jgi:hypothetical protein
MSDGKQQRRDTQTRNIQTGVMGATADMLSVVGLLLAVIYADGDYDAWDIALSTVALVLCLRRLYQFPGEIEPTPPRIVARLGIALAVYVFGMFVVEIVTQLRPGKFPPSQSPIVVFLLQKEIVDVGIVLILFGLIWLCDQRLLTRKSASSTRATTHQSRSTTPSKPHSGRQR